MQSVPTGLRTHSQKVCSFYKRAVRSVEDWNSHDLETFREQALLVRKQIDENANIKDLRLAKELLLKGENILERTSHPFPIKFPTSPGGCAYGRVVTPPDWVLDFWDPIEKAKYPKYFALREQRKLDYEKFFNKQYPDAPRKFDNH